VSNTPRTETYVLNPLPQIVSAEWARQLERELNAANDRIKRLEEELNYNGLVLQKIQHERDGSNARIKRLEEAGDAILNATSDDEQYKAMKQWRKAKEAKL
jgi:hypothetical protein